MKKLLVLSLLTETAIFKKGKGESGNGDSGNGESGNGECGGMFKTGNIRES